MKTISTPWTSGTHSSVRILVSNLKCIFSCSNSFSSNVDVDMNAACNSEIYEVFFLTSASADVFSLFPVLFFFLFFLGMYHDIYLESDVYLLADVFEHFRTTALSTYGLDPAHYLSLPGFSWDALLKQTNVSLDLLSDVDMHLFVEKGNCLVLAIHV